MSILSVLGADAKADAAALFTSFAQDDLGKIAIDAVTVLVDGVESLIDPTDQAQLATAEATFLNDAETAGTDVASLVRTDVQALLSIAVQAAVAGAVTSAVAGA